MKLILPQNIFTASLKNCIQGFSDVEIAFLPSAVISAEIEKNENFVGLIPTLDLINHQNLFVSKSFGLCFESSLCNTYIYFNENEQNISDVFFSGDCSTTDILLTKILFKENFELNIIPHLITNKEKTSNSTFVKTGNENFNQNFFLKGLSLSEEVMEISNFPFVNFIFASQSSNSLQDLNKILKNINDPFYASLEMENSVAEFQNNVFSVIVDFELLNTINIKPEDAIDQLIRLPYFYGLIDDIFDIKFI